MNTQNTIGMKEVRRMMDVWGRQTTDFAAELCGDPYLARKIARRVFLEMLGGRPEEVAPGERLPAWLADQVVRHSLEHTGNPEVADWEEYQQTHVDPDEERARKERRAARAARRQTRGHATSKARTTLRATAHHTGAAATRPPADKTP